MRIRLAVFAGLLLVFTLNSGNSFAAVIDKDNLDSRNINVVCDRNDMDAVNVFDRIVDRLDSAVDKNVSLNGGNLDNDSFDNDNLNVEDNLGYVGQLADGGVDLSNVQNQSPTNVNGDIDKLIL